MNKQRWVNIIGFVLVIIFLIIIFIIGNGFEMGKKVIAREPETYSWDKVGKKNIARKHFREEIKEYQPTIKPEMIISIKFNKAYGGGDRYTGKPIVDWKLDKLAFAMASAPTRHGGDRTTIFLGELTIEMDTTGTEIEPDVRLVLAYNNSSRKYFFVYFDLVVMQDGESVAFYTFGGKELIEWAISVGIADEDDW